MIYVYLGHNARWLSFAKIYNYQFPFYSYFILILFSFDSETVENQGSACERK